MLIEASGTLEVIHTYSEVIQAIDILYDKYSFGLILRVIASPIYLIFMVHPT